MLRLDHDIRSLPLLAQPDGTYVVTDGPSAVLAKTVSVASDADGVRTLMIDDFDPVRWLTVGMGC